MKNNFESQENTDYRNEQAEKLNDLRNSERKIAAIEYLGVLRSDPRYQEARRAHKNILAKASNETIAEDMISNIEIKAAMVTRSLNLGVANLLAGDRNRGIENKQIDLDDTARHLDAVEFMQTVEEEVQALENSGSDKETIVKNLTDQVALLTNELAPLFDKLNAENTKKYQYTYVEDIASVVSSWFDGIREMIADRNISNIDSKITHKESERAFLQWILDDVKESDADLNVSIIIDRTKIRIKKLIEADMKDWNNKN